MNFDSTVVSLAHELDREDELRHFRDEFVIHDPNLVYLDGNSLGRLPKRTVEILREAVEFGWGERADRVRSECES